MYCVQAAPLVSFVLVAFRVLQRWIIEFRIARGEHVIDPAHPERNTPESFIAANAETGIEHAIESGIDNRIETITNANEEEHVMPAAVLFLIFVLLLVIAIPVSITLGITSVLPSDL